MFAEFVSRCCDLVLQDFEAPFGKGSDLPRFVFGGNIGTATATLSRRFCKVYVLHCHQDPDASFLFALLRHSTSGSLLDLIPDKTLVGGTY